MKKAIFFRSEYDLSLHGLFNSFNNYVDDGSWSLFTDNDTSAGDHAVVEGIEISVAVKVQLLEKFDSTVRTEENIGDVESSDKVVAVDEKKFEIERE